MRARNQTGACLRLDRKGGQIAGVLHQTRPWFRGGERLSERRRPRTVVRVLDRSVHRPARHEGRETQVFLLSHCRLPRNKTVVSCKGSGFNSTQNICELCTPMEKYSGYGYTWYPCKIAGCRYGYHISHCTRYFCDFCKALIQYPILLWVV